MAGENSGNDNYAARSWGAVKDVTRSPLGLAAGIGGLTWLGTRLLWRPSMETSRSLGRGLANLAGRRDTAADVDAYADEQLDGDGKARGRVSAFAGLSAAALTLALAYNKRYKWGGLLSWDREPTDKVKAYEDDHVQPMVKTEALRKIALDMGGYVDQLDWSRRVPLRQAQGLFTNDPFLQHSDRYAMNMGTAIVTDAAIRQNTSRPTLGGVFDSAADKIGNKLSLGGLADVGVRSMVANGAARLFTGAVGAMFDLGPKARNTLVDAGTWAGTISAILN